MFGRTNNSSTRTGAGTAAGVDGAPRSSGIHKLFQDILRALQFLSATTSLILFSLRIAKIIRLVHRASRSNGAVEGILAAAVLYTLAAMVLQRLLRAGGGNSLRLMLVIFDLLFVGAFIAVAVLTSPKRHGSSGPCTNKTSAFDFLNHRTAGKANCKLPWGTFILAIFSTILHAITAATHAAKDHRRTRRNDHIANKEAQYHGRDGFLDGQGPDYYNGRSTRV